MKKDREYSDYLEDILDAIQKAADFITEAKAKKSPLIQFRNAQFQPIF